MAFFGVPGLGGALTGLYATALAPEALFDAYRQRRTLAMQGFFAYVDFRVNGVLIGSETTSAGPPEIEATVETPEPIEFVDVIRDRKKTENTSTFEDQAGGGSFLQSYKPLGTPSEFYSGSIADVYSPNRRSPAHFFNSLIRYTTSNNQVTIVDFLCEQCRML